MSQLNKILFWRKKKNEPINSPMNIFKPENRLKISEFYISDYKQYSRSNYHRIFYIIDSIIALIDNHKLDFPKIKDKLKKFVKKSKCYETDSSKTEYYFNPNDQKISIHCSHRPKSFHLKLGNSKLTFLEIEKMFNEVKNKILAKS